MNASLLKHWVVAAAVAALALFGAKTSSAAWTEGYGPYGGVNLIANGSFESLDGWTGDGGQAANEASGTTWISARSMPDGTYGYFFWHEEAVSRSFTVPEGQGGTYRLSFFCLARPAVNSTAKKRAISYSGNRVRAWVDGVEVGSKLTTYSYWEFVEFPVTLTPGEHTLCIGGDCCNTGWDASAAIDCVALELPPDPTMKVNPPTIADYQARLAVNEGLTLENPGGKASEMTVATGEVCAGPAGVDTAFAITSGGTFDLGEDLRHSWSVAARFRADANLGTVFALGKSNVANSLNLVVVNDAVDHLSVRLYAAWGTGNNVASCSSVEVGVPNLSTRFHSVAVVFRRVSNGAYSLSLQRHEVYVDGVMVGQLQVELWDNTTYDYRGNNYLQFGGVYGGNPNGLAPGTGYTFDDVRFYNRPLSADEVRLYAETFPAQIASGAADDGATFIAPGETLTAATVPEPCFNFGTLELTADGTVAALPKGSGIVRLTGDSTLALTTPGNRPIELAGDVTIDASSHLFKFLSSPVTVSGGAVTLAGDVTMNDGEDRYSVNGGVLNVTGGTVSGGGLILSANATDCLINISDGTVTSAVRPTGSTRQLIGHCVNVSGGVFAPASLAYVGNTDPGSAVALVVNAMGEGVFVPPAGMFPAYVDLRGDGVGVTRIANETAFPLYSTIPTRLEFVEGGKLMLGLATYSPDRHTIFTTAGVVVPEGHSIAEFVQLSEENFQIALSDDGKSICAVYQDTSVPFTATWIGGGTNGVVTDAANWSCFNCNGMAIPGAIPNRDFTAVTIPSNSNFSCAAGQTVNWKSLAFDGPVVLTSDRDWRGLPLDQIPEGMTIDLCGRNLFLAASSQESTPSFTVTDTTYGECLVNGGFESGDAGWNGWINLASKQKKDPWLGDNKMSPHSGGKANATWENQSFSQTFTVKVGGRFELSFWHLPRVDYPVGHRLHVAIDGVDVTTFDTEVASWVERRVAFDLTAGEHTLTLTGDPNGSTKYPACVTDDFSLRRLHQVGGGELHIEVPEGETYVNTQIALAGGVRLVKEGKGTFVGKRKSQTCDGGLRVAEGRYVVFNDAPDTVTWSPYDEHAMTMGQTPVAVSVEEGASLNIAGNYDIGMLHLTLNGGTVENDDFVGSTAAFNMTQTSWYGIGDVSLSADSRYRLRYDTLQFCAFDHDATVALNGHTLTAVLGTGRKLLWGSDITDNGTLKVEPETVGDATALFRVPTRSVNAQTVTLDVAVPMDLAYDLTVSNYVSRLTAGDNTGTAALNVYGTFKPCTDRFYGCTLQDGSTLDLSSQTGLLWTESACSAEIGANTLTFAPDATITVDLGARKVKSGRVMAWTTPPENAGTVQFRHPEGVKYWLSVKTDGLYVYTGFFIILR